MGAGLFGDEEGERHGQVFERCHALALELMHNHLDGDS